MARERSGWECRRGDASQRNNPGEEAPHLAALQPQPKSHKKEKDARPRSTGYSLGTLRAAVGLRPPLRITLWPLAASRLHWRAGSVRSFAAIREAAGIFCGSFLQKGEVLADVGRIQNLKDLKDPALARSLYRGTSLIRNSAPLGPYSRTMAGALWWSLEEDCFS